MTNNILDFILNNIEYFEDMTTRSTYNSNAIEGNSLTYVETYAILFNDNSFKIEAKTPREIYEAINHKKAMTFSLKNLIENKPFDERFIKKINEIINQDILGTNGYRNVTVYIKGAKHIPPAPEKIPNLMNYFVYNYNNSTLSLFDKIATYHIEFEKIHPFEDGNGRTGRLLINYELLKNNLPPAIIDKEDRSKYYGFLEKKDFKGLSSFLEKISSIELKRLEKFGFDLSAYSQISNQETPDM